MISTETKRQIGIQLSNILSNHLNKFTPVVAVHDGNQIIDHGSGTFLLIDDTPIVVTAAHVIKDYDDGMIRIIGTFKPSDYRQITPMHKEFMGGSVGDLLDVGYLILPKECILQFGIESFATTDRIELFPEKLSTDLTVFYGMPEVLHDHPSKHEDRFQPFMYMAGIEDDTDWSKPGNRQLILTMGYPLTVKDTISGQHVKTHKPFGMSGGGIWRSYINRTASVYSADLAKLIGIGTEWIKSTDTIRANRIEAVIHLLMRQFPSLEKLLECPTSGC
jgi:hypothetical protein